MPSLRARPFGCAQLEGLFRHQQLHRSAGELLRLLSLLVPAQLLLALWRVPWPDQSLLWLSGSASVAIVLALFLAFLPPSAQHWLCPLCAFWLCSNLVPLLAWPLLALLPCLLLLFLLYAFFPTFPLPLTVLLSAGLSLAQLTALATLEHIGSAKFVSIILAHCWTHLVGIWLFCIGQKISRAVFLNARNAVEAKRELDAEHRRMAQLLSTSLPPHVVQSVQGQLARPTEVPRVFVEHFPHSSVVFARLYGLPSVLATLQVSDSARLLNELDSRFHSLALARSLQIVPSAPDSLLAVSGLLHSQPRPADNHSARAVDQACQFAVDLMALVQSFCSATSAQLSVRVGIGSGPISAGVVGAKRWHWDIIGLAVDAAYHLEGICPAGAILVSEDSWRLLGGRCRFPAERMAQPAAWRLDLSSAVQLCSSACQSLLFPAPPRRFSLTTLQQAVLRLLQQQPPSLPASAALSTPLSKRKQMAPARASSLVGPCQHLDSVPGPLTLELHPLSLQFADPKLERMFNAQPDRWLFPALALSVLFLALYGLCQALTLPPQWQPVLITLALALGLMLLLVLLFYVSLFESFCHFVSRTLLGHSLAVLLVLALLCTCALVNTFSCPTESFSSAAACLPSQLPALSFALWMIHSSVFVRLPSLLLLLVLLSSLALFSLHLFLTHSLLYAGLLSQVDILVCLLCLALFLFMFARRNELLLRADFLALYKSQAGGAQLERLEYLNEQILLNSLPSHIAFNFATRLEPYAQLCPSVGILSAKLGKPSDWVGEFGFDRLNRMVCELDQRLSQLSERMPLEKVRSAHSCYTVTANARQPECERVHDTPCTIGEQLAVLAELAQEIETLVEAEGLDVAIGLDCGPALSLVLGGERPRHELFGQPVTRAKKLAEAAGALGGGGCVLLSEVVFLALRPRPQFHFDERSALSIGPGLVGYSLLRPCPPAAQHPVESLSPSAAPPPPPHRTELPTAVLCSPSPAAVPRVRANPLADAIMSASCSAAKSQSLCSSILSVDLSIETDSLELEWVTPEMIEKGEYRPFPDPVEYKADRARLYSDFSEAENQMGRANGRKRTSRPPGWTNGPAKLLRSWRSSANTSAPGSRLSIADEGQTALEQLNSAARRVDRMLRELAGVTVPESDQAFPKMDGTFGHPAEPAQRSDGHSARREDSALNHNCLSEYDNDGNVSDWEMFRGNSSSRLDKLRFGGIFTRAARRAQKGLGAKAMENGHEADISRNCSQSSEGGSVIWDDNQIRLASSTACGRSAGRALALRMRIPKWRQSIHSIGYEDEYELASAPLSSYSSSGMSLGAESEGALPSVGESAQFVAIDDDDNNNDEADCEGMTTAWQGPREAKVEQQDGMLLRKQVLELSRDIQRNFGDFQLSTFPDEQQRKYEQREQ